MPNPQVGLGAAVSKGLQVCQWAFYVAAQSSGASYPTNKLGAASEPTGGWVRVGRLVGDTITLNIPAPQFFEGRAGWAKNLQIVAVQQAEDITLTLEMDESDPDVQAKLRNTTATSLSNGSNTGEEFIYKTGQSFGAKVLLIGVSADPNGTRERHLYFGKAVVTYNEVHNAQYEGLVATVKVLDVSSSETYRHREWE